MKNHLIRQMFNIFYEEYGPQHWWPAKTPFEVCVGAILTQNTSWRNVEKAIREMEKEGLLDYKRILECEDEVLEKAIQSSGFYKQKAKRLKEFCKSIDFDAIKRLDVMEARKQLLSINGIGKETADSMLLYAFKKPIFVIDAYTKRIYSRVTGEYVEDYDTLREMFEDSLGRSVKRYNEMHALLVEHAKLYCTKNNPKCTSCPIKSICKYSY
ncbi:MAG: endonuclease III domain-containing protein [Candidatus Micrarchaeia archaeon]